jgi:glutathione S-transferase
MVGGSLSYVDLSLFQVYEGLRFGFPNTMKRVEPQYPGLSALHDRTSARPNIAAYRRSPRHMAFNDRGMFRHYPELDVS